MDRSRIGKHSFIPYDNVALSLAGGSSGGDSGDGGDRRHYRVVVTPQLQQALKLLQLSSVELREVVRTELQNNPVLEEAVPDEIENDRQTPAEDHTNGPGDLQPSFNRELPAIDKIGVFDWQDYLDTHSNAMHGSLTAEASTDDNDFLSSSRNTPIAKTSLEDHLLWQLRLSGFTDREMAIGAIIIWNLDEYGYFGVPLDEICAMAKTDRKELESILRKIQFFDPVGVGARDLRECLLIQLENLQLSDSLAARITASHLALLESKQYAQLAGILGVTTDEVIEAEQLIASLEPWPSRGYGQDEMQAIEPDVFVERASDEWVTYLNEEGVPRLRVSSLYRRMAAEEKNEEVRKYLMEKVHAATWLIKSIKLRQQTLLRVTQSIVNSQREFLENGVSRLKPMVLSDIAKDKHESTLSRAVMNKYAMTPHGLFELKTFFQNKPTDPIDIEIANNEINQSTGRITTGNDSQWSTDERRIVSILSFSAVEGARRTIANYRTRQKNAVENRRFGKTPELPGSGAKTMLLKQELRAVLALSFVKLEGLIKHRLRTNPALEESFAGQTSEVESLTLEPLEDVRAGEEGGAGLPRRLPMKGGDSGRVFETKAKRGYKHDTLEDILIHELRLSGVNEEQMAIGSYIIQNIDEEGSLTVSLNEVAKATGADLRDVERTYNIIRCFDPATIATIISGLEPPPRRSESLQAPAERADVFVENTGDEWRVCPNEHGLPRLRVSLLHQRIAAIERAQGSAKQGHLQRNVRAARWLIRSIRVRERTLLRLAQHIFSHQGPFLYHGLGSLELVSMKDVAADLRLRESTIRSVLANKHVHTPHGLFALKFFCKE